MAPDPVESQPSMHALAPSGLDTKMDALITQVTYLTQLMTVQQTANMERATMHTIIDEDGDGGFYYGCGGGGSHPKWKGVLT
jgi:hypothetical protein